MRAYKGFNKDMTCRGFQYEEGKAAVVDGITLKPDTWYALKDGEFVEVDE